MGCDFKTFAVHSKQVLLYLDLRKMSVLKLLGCLNVIYQFVDQGLVWGEDFTFESFYRLKGDFPSLANCSYHVVLDYVEPFSGKFFFFF